MESLVLILQSIFNFSFKWAVVGYFLVLGFDVFTREFMRGADWLEVGVRFGVFFVLSFLIDRFNDSVIKWLIVLMVGLYFFEVEVGFLGLF